MWEDTRVLGSLGRFLSFCASFDIFNPSFMKSICLIVEGRGAEGGRGGDSQNKTNRIQVDIKVE